MAHHISFSGNRHEAAYAGNRPAWHGLGTVLSENIVHSHEMLTAAHLDWSVSKRPIFDQNGKPIPDYYASTRDDSGKVLGIVKGRYGIIQNHESFDFLDSLMQDGLMRYESAGALFGGRVVWVLGRMPSVDEVIPGDNLLRYIMFQTSHDGSLKLTACPTAVRVVCHNTVRAASNTEIKMQLRHTTNVKERLGLVRQWLSQYDSKFTLFRDHSRLIAGRKVEMADIKTYLTTLFPEPKEKGRGYTLWDNKLTQILTNLEVEAKEVRGYTPTLWNLLNAVTQHVDHQSTFRASDDLRRRENRLSGLITGLQSDLKRRAFDLAVSMAQ